MGCALAAVALLVPSAWAANSGATTGRDSNDLAINQPISESLTVPVHKVDTRELPVARSFVQAHPSTPAARPPLSIPDSPSGVTAPRVRLLSHARSITPNATINTGFAGIGDTGWVPPDPMMAASTTSVLVSVNDSFAAYSRSGALQAGPTTFQSFFGTVPSDAFDARAIYDPGSARFIMAINAPTAVYIAVSSNNNASPGTWCQFAVHEGSTVWPNNTWPDYPLLGADQNFVYVATNVSNGTPSNPGSFKSDVVIAFQKSNLLNCTNIPTKLFGNLRDPGTGNLFRQNQLSFGIDPEINLTPSVSGSNGYLVDTYPNGGCHVTLWTVTGTTTALAKISGKQVGTQCYSPGNQAPQKGSTIPVEIGTNELTQVIGNSGLVEFATSTPLNTGCSSGDTTGISWFILNGPTKADLRQGAFGITCEYLGLPGMAPFVGGGWAFVFGDVGANIYPVTSTATIDASGNPTGSAVVIHTSAGPDTIGGNAVAGCTVPCSRWGDVFSIQQDPSNGNDVWTIGQYMVNNTQWGTWVDRLSG